MRNEVITNNVVGGVFDTNIPKMTVSDLVEQRNNLFKAIVDIDNQVLNEITNNIIERINDMLCSEEVSNRVKKALIKLNPKTDFIVYHDIDGDEPDILLYEIVRHENIYNKYLSIELEAMEEEFNLCEWEL